MLGRPSHKGEQESFCRHVGLHFTPTGSGATPRPSDPADQTGPGLSPRGRTECPRTSLSRHRVRGRPPPGAVCPRHDASMSGVEALGQGCLRPSGHRTSTSRTKARTGRLSEHRHARRPRTHRRRRLDRQPVGGKGQQAPRYSPGGQTPLCGTPPLPVAATPCVSTCHPFRSLCCTHLPPSELCSGHLASSLPPALACWPGHIIQSPAVWLLSPVHEEVPARLLSPVHEEAPAQVLSPVH